MENDPRLNNLEYMRVLCKQFQDVIRDTMMSEAVGIYDPKLLKRMEEAVTTDIGRVRHF